MSNIIPSAATHQTPVALNHLAPVIDLLSRSITNPKPASSGAGARRWPMNKSFAGRAYSGAKSMLAFIGLAVWGLYSVWRAYREY